MGHRINREIAVDGGLRATRPEIKVSVNDFFKVKRPRTKTCFGDASKKTWKLSSTMEVAWVCLVERTPANTRTALHWTLGGKRKTGRPRTTWTRIAESEIKAMQHSWGSLTRLAQNRHSWRDRVYSMLLLLLMLVF